jgi:hypothetical protein
MTYEEKRKCCTKSIINFFLHFPDQHCLNDHIQSIEAGLDEFEKANVHVE